MKVAIITQARVGSTRLPNKVLLKIQEKTLLEIHINRIKKAKSVDTVFVATTDKESDMPIVNIAKRLNVKCYKGSEDDVLDRFYQPVKDSRPDYIVRLTSDCPLIDPYLIDDVVNVAIHKNLDYYTNTLEERYPDGQDIEVLKFSALEKAWKEAESKSDREHVTPYIRNNSSYKGGKLFVSDNHFIKEDFGKVRLTVDEPVDFEVIRMLIEHLGTDKDWLTYANFYLQNRGIREMNEVIERNEGYRKSIEKEKNK